MFDVTRYDFSRKPISNEPCPYCKGDGPELLRRGAICALCNGCGLMTAFGKDYLEHFMTAADKQKVREWQRKRVEEHEPPPSPEEIREQLGWNLVEAEREQRDERND